MSDTVGLTPAEVSAIERDTALAYEANQSAAATPSPAPSTGTSSGPPLATAAEIEACIVVYANPFLPSKGPWRGFGPDEKEERERFAIAAAAFANRYGLWLELNHKEAIAFAVVCTALGVKRYREHQAEKEAAAKAKLAAKPENRPSTVAA